VLDGFYFVTIVSTHNGVDHIKWFVVVNMIMNLRSTTRGKFLMSDYELVRNDSSRRELFTV
jgi:hypothetical protein